MAGDLVYCRATNTWLGVETTELDDLGELDASEDTYTPRDCEFLF